MMEALVYLTGLLLLASCLLGFWIKTHDRRLTLSLLQVLLSLPLLGALYLYFAGYAFNIRIAPLVVFSESIFAVLWLGLSFRLGRVPAKADRGAYLLTSAQVAVGILMAAFFVFFRTWDPGVHPVAPGLAMVPYDRAYLCAFFLLIVMLFAAWQIEVFWRALEPPRRWQYKFFIVGAFTICGAFAWAGSYRLTYGLWKPDHFYLLLALLFVAWLFMIYAVARHKLLNRKIFISRKVVYTFVAPTIFAVYLLILGLVSLFMRIYGLEMPYVLQWLAISLGIIAAGLFFFSGKLRQRVKFFISTHFYVNKYEYRDEWLALSTRLQGSESESDVIGALQQVLSGSLYASRIVVWTGDAEHGYKVVSANPENDSSTQNAAADFSLAPDDPLIHYLVAHTHLNIQDENSNRIHKELLASKKNIFETLGIVLMAPIAIGHNMVGLIGLGPEFTGGRYGNDDYDLLTTIGSQTATALMAVRMAEKFAEARERRAWDRLSAFVLHDIKNAAAMLSLVQANAAVHIQNPAFQEEMLEAVDDALARMNKVKQRMDALQAEVEPVWKSVHLVEFLNNTCGLVGKKLWPMTIDLKPPPDINLKTDPVLLFRILENLLLNAFEAGGEQPEVKITVKTYDSPAHVLMTVADNGPGISESLLPNALFEPFKSTKASGSGIGLWQASQLAVSLNGSLRAENHPGGGACFILRIPL